MRPVISNTAIVLYEWPEYPDTPHDLPVPPEVTSAHAASPPRAPAPRAKPPAFVGAGPARRRWR